MQSVATREKPDAMANGHQFKSMSPEEGQELQRQFNEVMSG